MDFMPHSYLMNFSHLYPPSPHIACSAPVKEVRSPLLMSTFGVRVQHIIFELCISLTSRREVFPPIPHSEQIHSIFIVVYISLACVCPRRSECVSVLASSSPVTSLTTTL